MFENKKISTLAEDFKTVGLIKGSEKEEKNLQEEKSKKIADVKKRRIAEAKQRKLAERKKKLAESKVNKKKQFAEQKRKRIALVKAKKLAESKKAKTKVKAEGKKTALENLMDIESRLKTSASFEEIMKAFENVSRVSNLALKKYQKLSEQDADKEGGRDAADRTDAKSSYNTIGDEGAGLDAKDLEKEGDVKHDKDDEQESKGGEPGEIDTTTGKYVGKDSQGEVPDKVKIAEMDELDSDEDEDEDKMGESEEETGVRIKA